MTHILLQFAFLIVFRMKVIGTNVSNFRAILEMYLGKKKKIKFFIIQTCCIVRNISNTKNLFRCKIDSLAQHLPSWPWQTNTHLYYDDSTRYRVTLYLPTRLYLWQSDSTSATWPRQQQWQRGSTSYTWTRQQQWQRGSTAATWTRQQHDHNSSGGRGHKNLPSGSGGGSDRSTRHLSTGLWPQYFFFLKRWRFSKLNL